jgi:hypothetical protein
MADIPKVDEFSFVLMASVMFIFLMAFAWTTPTESAPYVKDTSFELSAAPGEKVKFDFTLSGMPKLTAVNLSTSGGIRNWITFSKNNFDVAESDKVTVTIKVPSNTTEGIYTGRVFVFGVGGKDQFSINIDVSGEKREMTSRTIHLDPDFTVSYYDGTDIVDSKTDITVARSHFSMRSLTLMGALTDEKLSIVTGGSVRLVIEETNSLGSLIVEMNGEEIYSRKARAGEIIIPIDESDIQKSNVITIRAKPPGIMFWANTYYRIMTAEFNVDYQGAFAKDFDFTLSKDEVDNFRWFKLSYIVPKGGYTVPLPELIIKINNQVVYWDVPKLTIFDETLSEDMFGNPLYLNEGTNTIIFMFEERAIYRVTNALFTVEYFE